MITLREVVAKYNSLGVPDSVYKGVIRQTDNFVTRLKIDLTDVPGDISNVGLNVKKGDGTTNTDGLIICHPIVGQVKHFYVDISNWFTNIPGTLEINVQALASMNGLTQVFNCSKIEFAIEGTAIELDPTVVPEFFNVLSVNGYAGVIDITMTNVGSGAKVVKVDPDNNTNWNIRTIKQGSHIEVVENENDITINVTNDIPTQTEVTAEISEHNTSESAHEDIREDIEDVAEDLGLHEANTNAHGLDQVKEDISQLESDMATHNHDTRYYTKSQTDSAIDSGVSAHNSSNTAHSDIRDEISEVRSIAQGKTKGYVFATYEDMEEWLAEHSGELNIGDNLYIEDTDVPDYWWNGSELKELETEKPDLTDYYKKESVYTKSEADNKFVQQEEGKSLFSGDYNDLTNKPNIPTKTSDLTNDSGFITEEDIPQGFSGDYNDLENKPTLFSGSYNDLTNKPTIPSKTSDLENDSGFITEEDLPEPYDDSDIWNEIDDINDNKISTLIKNIQLLSNGVFRFTKYDNTYFDIDTKLEKVVTNFTYNATTKNLELSLDDNTVLTIPMSAFIDDYSGSEGTQFVVNVSSENVISVTMKDGTVTYNQLAQAVKDKLDSVYTLPQATETTLGGVKVRIISDYPEYYSGAAMEPIAIDPTTGKLHVKKWMLPTDYYNKSETETLINNAILGLLGGES